MTAANALESCPKCGSADVAIDQYSARRDRYVVTCEDCDNTTATYEGVAEAIAAWNRSIAAHSVVEESHALLVEQHEALGYMMEQRRVSANEWERDKAKLAIAVWRKVQAFLAAYRKGK